MSRYTVSWSMHCGEMLPCVRDENHEVVASGCLLEDARLFAAAPELLEALVGLVENACAAAEVLPDNTHRVDATEAEWDAHVDATEKARAAIAKARGEA